MSRGSDQTHESEATTSGMCLKMLSGQQGAYYARIVFYGIHNTMLNRPTTKCTSSRIPSPVHLRGGRLFLVFVLFH